MSEGYRLRDLDTMILERAVDKDLVRYYRENLKKPNIDSVSSSSDSEIYNDAFNVK